MKFLLPKGPMLTKTKKKKKNRKNLNISKKEKKIVWRYGGEGATHKIWYGSMQRRFPRNLSLQTTDGRTDDGRLRHDSSSADKVKRANKITSR